MKISTLNRDSFQTKLIVGGDIMYNRNTFDFNNFANNTENTSNF